jgi:hypothetical protein
VNYWRIVEVMWSFGSDPHTKSSRQWSPRAASCQKKKKERINSLKNRTLTASGLKSFYAQAAAMRILEKEQVTLLKE